MRKPAPRRQASIVAGSASALVQQRERLGVVGPGDAVDDEARRRARMHRRLAPALAQLEDRRRHVGVGLQAGDDLDQLHQRHRVEEVHADHAARLLQAVGERGDRDRRRVRGQHAVARRRSPPARERAAAWPRAFSTIASTTSRRRPPRRAVAAEPMRAASACASAPSSLPLATRPSSVAASLARAASAAPSRTSNSRTGWPAWAATCAMPAPMMPAPTTKTGVSLRRSMLMRDGAVEWGPISGTARPRDGRRSSRAGRDYRERRARPFPTTSPRATPAPRSGALIAPSRRRRSAIRPRSSRRSLARRARARSGSRRRPSRATRTSAARARRPGCPRGRGGCAPAASPS